MSTPRTGFPYFVGKDHVHEHSKALKQMPIGAKETEISKGWLQELIIGAPDVLPAFGAVPGLGHVVMPLVQIGSAISINQINYFYVYLFSFLD